MPETTCFAEAVAETGSVCNSVARTVSAVAAAVGTPGDPWEAP